MSQNWGQSTEDWNAFEANNQDNKYGQGRQRQVWMVNAPYLIVTLANGQNKQYKAPEGMKFDVGGQEKTVFNVRKRMNLTATVVTTRPTIVMAKETSITGSAPRCSGAKACYAGPGRRTSDRGKSGFGACYRGEQ